MKGFFSSLFGTSSQARSANHDLESEEGLKRAASGGNATAQFMLGIKYVTGELGVRDNEVAAKWLLKAAEQGHPDAQFAIGAHFHRGHGVPQNHGEGVRWYRAAADQGHAGAQFNLGYCYEIGEGVDKNKNEAINGYRRSAAQGDSDSQAALEDLLASTDPILFQGNPPPSTTPPRQSPISKLPTVEDKVIETDWGACIGHRAQWDGGQYCGLITHRGIIGCGAYDVRCLEEFGMIVAIARGTPEHPLVHPEDLFDATIADLTRHAEAAGIRKGMTGKEALRVLLSC